MTDVDPRDGDVVKLVAVGVGRNGALMRRPKTLDLGIERKAVDDRKYAEPGCEHHGSCVAEQVDLGQSSRSALRRRGPGPTRPRPDETDPHPAKQEADRDHDRADDASADRVLGIWKVAAADGRPANHDHED